MWNHRTFLAVLTILSFPFQLFAAGTNAGNEDDGVTFLQTHSKECVFHSNFYNPLQSVNEGLEIGKGALHPANEAGGYSASVLEKQLSDSFVVDVAFPVDRDSHQTIIYSFQDDDNFRFIDVSMNWRGRLVARKGSSKGGVISYGRPFCESACSGVKLSLVFHDNSCTLLDDGQQYGETPVDMSDKRAGYLLTRKYAYRYRIFNVFNLIAPIIYDATSYIDKGEIDNKISRSKDKMQTVYAHTSEKKIVKSGRSERFELHYDDPTIKTSARSEVTITPAVRPNLRSIDVSFDIFLPKDYAEDEYYEVLFQAHDTPDPDKKDQSLNPNIALRTRGNMWYLSVNGDSRTKDLSDHKYEYHTFNPLKPFERNRWTHFDILINEGYMPEHNPLIVVLIDGEEAFRTTQPNCYNNQKGSYFKYGIYKSDWMKGNVGSARKRVIYFDNVVIKQK